MKGFKKNKKLMKPAGQVHWLFYRPAGLQINILLQWDYILR